MALDSGWPSYYDCPFIQPWQPLYWGKGELQSPHPAAPPPVLLLSYLAGVQSALYGLVLSLLICVAAVAVFTTHVLLLLPVLLSILGTCAQGDGRCTRDGISQGTWQKTADQGCVCGWWNSGPGWWGWGQVGAFRPSRPQHSLSLWPSSLSKGPCCNSHPSKKDAQFDLV